MAKKRADDGGLENITLQPWWWRTRFKMAPIYAAISVILIGLLLKLMESTTQVLTLVGIVATLLIILTRAKYATGKKKDMGMATFLYVVITVYFGLILAIRFNWWPINWTLIGLTGAFAILGLFWWFDRKNLRMQEIEEEQRRWPELAKKIGLEKVRKGVTRVTATGRRVRLSWNPGDATLDGVRSHARQLESAFGIPDKMIRFEPVLDEDGLIKPNMIDVAENTKTPALKAPVPFDRPTMTSVYDRMFIGPLENGEDYTVVWFDKKWGGMHTLAAGQTGSGKSGLFDLIFAESIGCPDLIKWGCDPKGGMTLMGWASTFDWFVTGKKGAESMLTAVDAILRERAEYAGSKGWKVWRASAKNPLLVVVIDECAEILGPFGPAGDLAESVARMGRAAGVLLLLATQYPTNDAIGSSQLTQQIGRRFCFSVLNALAQRVILPGSAEKNIDASQIPIGPDGRPGTFYTSEGGQINELSGRVRYVSEEKIRELVTEVGDAVGRLDRLSADAASLATVKFKEESYDDRRIYLLEDLPPLGEDEDGEDEEAGAERDDEEAGTVRMTKGAVAENGSDGRSTTTLLGDAPPPDEGSDDEDEDLINFNPMPREGAPSASLSIGELADSISPEERDRAIAEYLLEKNGDTRISTEEAMRRFDAALDASGPDGLTVKELVAICGRGSSTVYNWLDDRTHDGLVEMVTRGRFRRLLKRRDPE